MASLTARRTTNISAEQLIVNLVSSLRRGLPTLDFGQPIPQKVALVAGGPSAKNYLDDLGNWDGYVVAINGAHDWLLDNDIIPDAMIVMDGLASMADYVQRANDETTYLVASSCASEVFDELEGKRVVLWHVMQDDSKGQGLLVCGGPSAVTRAPYLLYMMGFRELHIYGADSSISGIQSHVYKNGLLAKDRLTVRVGSEVFISTGALVLQAEYLWTLKTEMPDDLAMDVHGYGLAKAIIEADGDFEVI